MTAEIHDEQQRPQYPPSLTDQADYDTAARAALLSTQSQLNDVAQQQSGDASTPTNPRKRKPAVPGSRGVANLTPEQLAKKRANDREAQRAIRERTKTTIEVLQARIRELESQQPYQEMQRALQERDRALSECEALKERLAAVAGIVGSQNIGQVGLNQLAALTAQQSPLPLQEQVSQHERAFESAQEYEQPQSQPHLHPDLRPTHEQNDGTTATPG